MAGLVFDLGVKEAVDAVRGAFEEFGERALPRAVQYSLNKVVLDGVSRFRRDEMPVALRHMNSFTRDGVRYELDRRALDQVKSVDDVVTAAFIQPLQSVWLKCALGEETRRGGDVGTEAYFPNRDQIYLPNEGGLGAIGIRPNGAGNYKGSDIRMIGRAMAQGYRTTGGARFGGIFEIKSGDRDPARRGVGIHARPMRGLAVQQRERVKSKVRSGKMAAPTTTFTRRSGQSVTVPKVVNLGVPQLLFVTRPEGHYKPVLTPGWERAMTTAASRMGQILEDELVNKMEHALTKARRRR